MCSAPHRSPRRIARNSRHLWTCPFYSLTRALCLTNTSPHASFSALLCTAHSQWHALIFSLQHKSVKFDKQVCERKVIEHKCSAVSLKSHLVRFSTLCNATHTRTSLSHYRHQIRIQSYSGDKMFNTAHQQICPSHLDSSAHVFRSDVR